ncbi:hypothetical protein TCAL_02245 [Tigriopus californicus]|uniref:Thioredoxin domain-containing protein n=1 Tax=Tigriopus californicus TaxID=6832 RepID=A0A553P6K0_TIGCA|nr:thioredoxin domain-containing protein 11-like [Tigriopus californicus]TRY73306.1 hypothetical protein TCAL_02245 [Tigriopus californicus]|eukprot:TCALIF_02245-PA protein Name:"Similar to TXNDC11 Thioredoxin domain-containing protein 11 (Homo sapiens)" AED:0.00 eAED:0.00 QI:157/1/1/1/0/0/2/154/793
MEDGEWVDELPLPLNPPRPRDWRWMGYKMAREALFFGLTFFFCIYTPYVQTNGPGLPTRSAPASVAFLPDARWVDDYYSGDVFAAFEEAQQHAHALVLFYAPWDVDSGRAVQVLEQVGHVLADHQDLYLAAVNCWVSHGECYKEFGAGRKTRGRSSSHTRMDQFPILVFYPSDKRGIQYNGPLTVQHITQFLLHAQNPLVRIDSWADLHQLQAQNGGQAVVGHFGDLSVAHVGRNYPRFLQAAYDLLEFDPFRTRYGGLGVVVSQATAYQLHLNPPHQPVKLFHWNGTASTFPNKTISNVNTLLKWIGEKANPLTAWTGTSGQKSLHLSSSLSLGSGHSLLAFIPRTMMNHFDPSLAVFQEAALRYYSCTQETREATQGLLRHIKYLKRTSNLELERTLLDCAQDPWFLKQTCNSLSKPPNPCVCASAMFRNRTAVSHKEGHPFMLKSRRSNQKPHGPMADEIVANLKVNQKRLKCALSAHVPNLCHILADVADPATLDAEFLDIGSDLDGLGCEDNKTLNFYTLDESTQSFLAQSLGVDLSQTKEPTLILVSPELESSFRMESNFNLETISDFVHQFHRRKDSLRRIQRSENPEESPEIAESERMQIIPRVNTNNFDRLVLNSSQNVALLYTSPSCGFCSSIAHIFHSVRALLTDVIGDDIVFYTVNAMNNDLSWSFTTLSVPSIMFVPVDNKSETRVFPSERNINVPNLLSFVIANLPAPSRMKVSVAFCDDHCLLKSHSQLQERLRNARDFNLFGDSGSPEELVQLKSYLQTEMERRAQGKSTVRSHTEL